MFFPRQGISTLLATGSQTMPITFCSAMAAAAVVGMAESIITENRERGVPGDVYGYSHNPHFKKTSNYHILIAPAVMYAYELTGDPEFLTHARAMYEQTIQEGTVNSIQNCYWNTHTLLYYLNRYGQRTETTP